MEKYKFDDRNGLWYELQGDYYLPCLELPEEEQAYALRGVAHHKLPVTLKEKRFSRLRHIMPA